MDVTIRELRDDDVAKIAATDGGPAWKGDRSDWLRFASAQREGRRVVLLAFDGEDVVAYGNLLWESSYPPFRQTQTPEINALVTAEGARRRGIATQMIHLFEARARGAGCRAIGIAVGLYADYGPAQRLYVRLGYKPDGNGLTSAGRPVAPGSDVRADDDLVLWLTKDLS
jgi:GNAT superfamily N-acetyltransferase